jgi:chromosomal replication initiator protein
MIHLSDIEAAVCEAFGVSLAAFRGIRRHRETAEARHAFVGIARLLTRKSLPDLGRYRGRDHTTMLNSVRRFAHLTATDAEYRDAVKQAMTLAQSRAKMRAVGVANINTAPLEWR